MWFAIDALGAASLKPTISFINVGQGNCIAIDCTNKRKVVVDCGSSTRRGVVLPEIPITADISAEIMGNHVRENYFKSGDQEEVVILITHPDQDHLNLLPYIFVEDKVSEIKKITILLGGPLEDYFTTDTNAALIDHFLNPDFRRKISIDSFSHDLESGALRKLAEESKRLLGSDVKRNDPTFAASLSGYIHKNPNEFRLRGHILDKSLRDFMPFEEGSFCPAFDVKVLSANAGQTPKINGKNAPFVYVFEKDNNANSVVLKTVHPKSGKSVILTGDATGITTQQIVDYYMSADRSTPIADLRPDIMLACHHGGHTHDSNDQTWIDATRADTTILSCGINRGYFHPSCKVVRRYFDAAASDKESHFVTCGGEDEEVRDLFRGFGIKKVESVPPRGRSARSFTISEKPTTGDFYQIENFNRRVYSTHDSGTIRAVFEDDKMIVEIEKSGSFEIRKSPTSLVDASRLGSSPPPRSMYGSSGSKKLFTPTVDDTQRKHPDALATLLKSSSAKPVGYSSRSPFSRTPLTSTGAHATDLGGARLQSRIDKEKKEEISSVERLPTDEMRDASKEVKARRAHKLGTHLPK